MESNKELLEIYKLHVEMADRISQRRLQTNRFYIALLSGVFVVLSFFINKTIVLEYGYMVFISASILGIILCFIWLINIHSYKQLNSGKFEVIHDLEKRLQYSFYAKEWDALKHGKSTKSYLQLTKVEKLVPCFMMIPYVLLLCLAIFAF